jgi:hypothetical protein
MHSEGARLQTSGKKKVDYVSGKYAYRILERYMTVFRPYPNRGLNPARGSAVVKALCYKPEGRGFERPDEVNEVF